MQNAEGRGPYVGYEGPAWADEPHDEGNGHPSPLDDGFQSHIINVLGTEWLCGFKDYDQAYAWFSEVEIEMLAALGFHLCEREAKQIMEGDHQILFLPA